MLAREVAARLSDPSNETVGRFNLVLLRRDQTVALSRRGLLYSRASRVELKISSGIRLAPIPEFLFNLNKKRRRKYDKLTFVGAVASWLF